MKTTRLPVVEKFLLVALVTFFTLAFFKSRGSSDVDRFWLLWMSILSEHAKFRDGFEAIWADYPPLSILFLGTIGKVAAAMQADVFVVLKTTVVFFLFSTSWVYYRISRCLTTTLLMHFLFLLSSVMLTYLDIYYAPFLVLSLWCLRANKPWTATILFAICCSIKYQPLIIAPFFVVYVWKIYSAGKEPWRKTVLTLGAPVLVTFVLMLAAVGWPLFTSMYNALFHTRISFQALNIYWVYMQGMISFVGSDERYVRGASTAMVYASRLVFLVFYITLLVKYARHGKSFLAFLLFALAGFYSYFILVSGVHENHLFIAAVLASVLYIVDNNSRVTALFVLLMNNINLLLFNGIAGGGLPFAPVFVIDMTIPLACINSIFYFFLVYRLLTSNYFSAEK